MCPRTLVVDDDVCMLTLIHRLLQDAGIPADTAGEAGEALRKMARGVYHAVVCDINMPGMNGIELVSALKAYNPLVQVIMLTSLGSMEKIVNCVDRGAFEFFRKTPGDMASLAETVRTALARIDRWLELVGHPAVPEPEPAAPGAR